MDPNPMTLNRAPRKTLALSISALLAIAISNVFIVLGLMAAGALCAVIGATCLVLWAMTIPSVYGEVWSRTRLLFESIATGSLAAMSVWSVMASVAEFETLETINYIFSGIVVIMLGIGWASFISLAVRDRDKNIALATIGVMIMVTGNDLWLTLYYSTFGFEWLGLILSGIGWILLGTGMLRANPPRPLAPSSKHGGLMRTRTIASSLVYVGFAIATLYTFLAHREAGTAPLVMGAIGVVSLVARDFTRTLQDDDSVSRYRSAAMVDALTGLGNRRAMTERFGELNAIGERSPVGVIALDVDRFKDINQIMGHKGGDKLLVDLATVLKRVCTAGESRGRSTYEPFRMGGDEFFILSLNATERECRDIAEEILARVQAMSGDENRQSRVSCDVSIGLVHRTSQQSHEWVGDPMVLITQAGAAKARSKNSGKDKIAAYSVAMEQGISRRVLVETRLRKAISSRELEPFFQPIVDLSSQQISGFEVLARWRDAELGNVSPLEFVSIAEEAGIIADVDQVIVEKAIENFTRCGAADLGIDLWINVSILELRTNAFENRILAALSRWSMNASQLVIEVTESVFVNTDDVAVRAMTRLADYGIRVAIDDFGTGYSGIGYLDRLPVHILKVDKSFTSNLAKPETRAVTKAVIDMANAHQLVVVIEGIETDVTHRHARFLQANLGQGWFFAAPLATDRVAEFIAEWQRQHPTWDSFRKLLGPDSQSQSSVSDEFTFGLFVNDSERT